MHPCRYGLGRNCFDQGLEKLLMDVSFEVILKDPVPHKVRGIAEVAGDPKGRWEVRDIWIATHPFGYRLAGYDERQNIRLALHMLAGGDIGRSYRGSLKIT